VCARPRVRRLSADISISKTIGLLSQNSLRTTSGSTFSFPARTAGKQPAHGWRKIVKKSLRLILQKTKPTDLLITENSCKNKNPLSNIRKNLSTSRQDKTRQDKTRQDKTRQDKTRHITPKITINTKPTSQKTKIPKSEVFFETPPLKKNSAAVAQLAKKYL
jgi:hypothetical protein